MIVDFYMRSVQKDKAYLSWKTEHWRKDYSRVLKKTLVVWEKVNREWQLTSYH